MTEHLRTKLASSAIPWLALALTLVIGCGSSLKNEHDGDNGTTTGGSAGEGGGSSGSSGSGGDAAQGGSSGFAGSSAQGGSAEGGSTQGGSAGAGGEGGDTIPTRLFLQTGNSLVAVDPETAETLELCPEATADVLYDLVDWVNERAIVLRRYITSPSAGELLRVALDGSECASLLLNESVLYAYSPVVGGRVVLATTPVLMGAAPAPNTGDTGVTRTVGLASFALEGSPLAELAPSGVFDARIVGEHVVFVGPGEAGAYDFFSARPDASSVVAPVPGTGTKTIAATQGRRVVVNALESSDVYAVDADGGNLAPLAVGPERDSGVGFVEDRAVITRGAPSGIPDEFQFDLFSIDTNGGELTPLATSADGELFRGQIGDLIIYERASDIYTARLDGSDALPVIQTPEIYDVFVASVGDRIVFGNGESVTYFSVSPDGSGLVTLHESSSGLTAIAGDRAVFYVGVGNYDLVSVPVAGGEPWLLADAPEPDWHVGTLGTTLVIQRGGTQGGEGTILRIDADGSRGLTLAPAARYVGAVTETCGALRANNPSPNDCAP